MLNQKGMAASMLATLCVAATLAPPPVHAAPPAAGQQGMVVVRDPQTGALRAPTADEARALLGNTAQRKAPAQHVETVGPGGSRKVQLGRSGLVYNVTKRAPDGTLHEQCVDGEHAAHAALTPDAQTRPAPDQQAKEPRHEAE
jgi:hypothetical protein